MRFIIVAVFLVGAFVAGMLVTQTNSVSAEDQGKRSQWQYQCVEATTVTQTTERANKMGQQGWELAASAGTKNNTLWCFKRPLWR